ncbi:YkgJ family cysteine cluster protein [Paraburkholderia acidiphila]|uniref:Flagellin N-methylase n=1 Tax=Paraburkholderia acidiphila TaxID=2571747 RepID=A0A7Z2GCB7_9BURK|nr:YkgJ family cysteine cluster protein [Paraburkholderia acidiphila]QGZ59186.1 flagellin N-methylase [Paraburkholderia acidiphila]
MVGPAHYAEHYALACTACGKCCNSPPSMSLAELLRHGERFVGCLAIGRQPAHRAGEHTLDAADAAAIDELSQALFHRSAAFGSDWIVLTLQGYDYPSLGRCPALADDGRCTLHETGKPAMCAAVPLDPLWPDRLQTRVLEGRRESAQWLGADCIRTTATATAGATPLVHEGKVADAEALTRFRGALAFERGIWRDAVFASLHEAAADLRDALARLGAGGHLTVSLAPALMAAARVSARCRELCVAYIDNQIALIERTVEAALARRRLDDRPVTRELRGFAQAYAGARELLAAPGWRHDAARADAPEIEAWLGAA